MNRQFSFPRALLIAVFLVFASSSVNSQVLVSFELIDSYTAAELNLVPGLVPQFDIDFYKIVYNTTDAMGQPTIASGALAKPSTDDCELFPIAIYQHGTTLNKDNVPSRNNAESAIPKLFGGLGFYGLAPDYVGMGDSPGLHPYLHGESEATAGVDMIRAVREFLADEGEVDNGEVLITGYSQGGHAAMAMHKYIEDNALLEEFNVIASGPGSGPYDLSTSQAPVILSGAPYSNPGYIVYTLASYETAYGNIYDSYSDVLQSPYDEVVVPYFDGNNFTYSMDNLNPLLPDLAAELLTPEFITSFETDENNTFKLALQANDNYDWTPTRPIRMYYCTADEQVDFSNSLTAEETMNANGATSVNAIGLGPLNHGNCYFPAMLGALNWFLASSTPCVSTVGLDELSFEVSFSPNPVFDKLQIQSDESIEWLTVVDMSGKEVSAFRPLEYGRTIEVDMNGIAEGTYLITLRSEKGTTASSLIMKK